jgi:putative endonuclease
MELTSPGTSPCHVDLAEDRARTCSAGHLATGVLAEQLAVEHLERTHGFTILARNWRVSEGALRGELDVVALDERADRLVVVEVKGRRDAQRFGGAVSAVSPRKRAQVRRLTAAFLRDAGSHRRFVRLDLVAVDLGGASRLTHLPGAL